MPLRPGCCQAASGLFTGSDGTCVESGRPGNAIEFLRQYCAQSCEGRSKEEHYPMVAGALICAMQELLSDRMDENTIRA